MVAIESAHEGLPKAYINKSPKKSTDRSPEYNEHFC